VQKNTSQNWRPHDILISIVVFAFLLVFTYGLLFVAPYPGFYFNPSDGEVIEVYQSQNSLPRLEKGDFIQFVGSIPFEDYRNRKVSYFFENAQRGDILDIVVQRDTEKITVHWAYPGFNRPEFVSRFFNVWWLAYIFWFVGMSTQLFMRPKDRRWWLFVASSYLMGMFIMIGSVSSYRTLESTFILRFVAWLILPIYLHFHWIFPKSLRHVPRWLQVGLYVICSAMAVGELILPIPRVLYFFTVILTFGGSILLLILHYIFQADHRREVGFLGFAAFIALFPAIITGIASSTGTTPYDGPASLLSLPILPGAYFFVLYRRSFGQLELRANRAVSLSFFLVLLGAVLLLAVGYSGFINIPQETIVFAIVMVALLTAFVSIRIFPFFQSFVERQILGIKLPSQSLSENYSARIITSNTLAGLLRLLRSEVFPSLLIRQYAFVRNLKTSAQVILSENVMPEQIREDALMELLASFSTGRLFSQPETGQPFDWVRLILPLQVGSDLMGIWLLGRRDPDDHYPQAELPALQSLANQTAMALSNIVQTERLKAMYAGNINRYELERVKLAHDLHDSVLNEMAAMKMKLDPSSLPPEFQTSYDELINRVREIVGDLRPPMLLYGLSFALNGLADTLSERNQDGVQIVSEVNADQEWRYPEIVELNLYRIVQEACENASKYAHAKSITIIGELSSNRIDIKVVDDGIGFRDEISLKLDEMLANKHFGLVGMHERADLIGAIIEINSKPGQGAQIRVLWESNDSI